MINYKRDRVPKAEELLRIADYFGVSFEWLLTGEDSRPHSASSAIWRERAIHAEKRLQDVKEILQTAIKKI